jgi:C1A family cysteine protease
MTKTSISNGCIPSKRDDRDQKYALSASIGNLPSSFELSVGFALDQGNEGTCVAHALKCVMDYQRTAFVNNDTRSFQGKIFLSQRDMYESGRKLGRYFGEGMQIRDALKNAKNSGICHEIDWVYIPRQTGMPSSQAPKSRQCNYLKSFHAVPVNIQDIKHALCYTKSPLVFSAFTGGIDGFSTTSSYTVSLNNNTGLHAMVIYGYDDARQVLKIQNSWGIGWGDKGRAIVRYSDIPRMQEIWACSPEFYSVPHPKPQARFWEQLTSFFGWN